MSEEDEFENTEDCEKPLLGLCYCFNCFVTIPLESTFKTHAEIVCQLCGEPMYCSLD